MWRFNIKMAVITAVVLVVSFVVARLVWPSLVEGGLVFTTKKMCQLTGEWDKQFDQPTWNFGKNFGITGSDLGFPVPWNGRLYFLFGDTRSHDPDEFKKDGEGWDSIAVGPLTADVDRKGCVELEFFKERDGIFRPVRFVHKGKLPRELGNFEVPVSGFGKGNNLFAFFTLRDRVPGCPRPEGCALGDPEPGGQTKLGLSNDSGSTFWEVALVSKTKFQFPVPVVAEANNISGLPPHLTGSDEVVLIWATGKVGHRFRHGYPYFAVAPLSRVDFMETWRYFTGLGSDGKPIWSNREADSVPLPPFGSDRYERDPKFGPAYHKCLGEFSVNYVDAWQKWVMLYTCGSGGEYNSKQLRGIQLRTADTPWGPWSEPRRIFDPENGYCRFMYSQDPNKCQPGQPNPGDNGWQETDEAGNPKGKMMWGGEYAPYLIPSYTKVDGDTTSLYWVMSTWNPYQSVLMRTQVRPLRLGDFIPRRVREVISGKG